MVNQEQVNLLKTSVEEWNKWRLELVDEFQSAADVRDAELADADLHGVDLSNAHLWKANLTNVNLIGADLSGANLRGANLKPEQGGQAP